MKPILSQMARTQCTEVVLHARTKERGQQAVSKAPKAERVLIADLSIEYDTKDLAEKVNKLGHFDAIIHNAGVYQQPNKMIFAVNTLAPFILTSLIQKPKRLIYLSSGMHMQGDASLKNFHSEQKKSIILTPNCT